MRKVQIEKEHPKLQKVLQIISINTGIWNSKVEFLTKEIPVPIIF